MKKKLIRLTESDLHNIIKESVKRIISEDVFDGNNSEVEDMARRKFIEVISKPFEIEVRSASGSDWGYFYCETSDDWAFDCDDIPLDLVIDSYSYYRPATWTDPEEYGDVEGYVDNIGAPSVVTYWVPGDGHNEREFQLDDEMKELFIKNARASEDISDALAEKENYVGDIEAGRREEYLEMMRDR